MCDIANLLFYSKFTIKPYVFRRWSYPYFKLARLDSLLHVAVEYSEVVGLQCEFHAACLASLQVYAFESAQYRVVWNYACHYILQVELYYLVAVTLACVGHVGSHGYRGACMLGYLLYVEIRVFECGVAQSVAEGVECTVDTCGTRTVRAFKVLSVLWTRLVREIEFYLSHRFGECFTLRMSRCHDVIMSFSFLESEKWSLYNYILKIYIYIEVQIHIFFWKWHHDIVTSWHPHTTITRNSQ